METQFTKRSFALAIILPIMLMSCQALTPSSGSDKESHSEESHSTPQQSGFPDKPAIPNDSGIEGVQTYPDKSVYHNHVPEVQIPEGNIPPAFGEHLNAWQNCGIYDQPIDLGNALHSLEHGAVWLTYAPNLGEADITNLQDLVRGHDFVLMSPYPPQTDPVVLTAWGVQLIIKSLPDDRIEKFIAYYELGPQNPEPGALCSGAIGNPLP